MKPRITEWLSRTAKLAAGPANRAKTSIKNSALWRSEGNEMFGKSGDSEDLQQEAICNNQIMKSICYFFVFQRFKLLFLTKSDSSQKRGQIVFLPDLNRTLENYLRATPLWFDGQRLAEHGRQLAAGKRPLLF